MGFEGERTEKATVHTHTHTYLISCGGRVSNVDEGMDGEDDGLCGLVIALIFCFSSSTNVMTGLRVGTIFFPLYTQVTFKTCKRETCGFLNS